ncbi:alpha/beta hydrolase [Streptomyces cocklensis]|uniref:Acetyl esterase/lipase n=1 Tax=Actinacidiphila cocklensis TaxID=887465 RepID=A0A9W4GVP9_9ACTN|nr:alpha/beta hydrolase [Actinacidiphila cocklensis]MDD1057778.1 alpha/beta hydrolase [Actinacidiphila cocklensis]WSX78712.1 alpha/beta hydrolase [Streptomyces sp. NBC_00899]CAG6398501.1 Acetyl esterase/lipase [Actinacidiphila cocklensis]
MSQQQRDTVAQILRNAPVDLGGEVTEQRELFAKMVAANPVPDGVRIESLSLDGIPALSIEPQATTPDSTVLYFHGGCFVVGSARASAGLAANLARKTGARVISVDYRLAPEHPYPAALDDALTAYRALLGGEHGTAPIAVAGESAGANLATALILAARGLGDLPQPACAVLFSPWADLTVPHLPQDAGLDPVINAGALRTRAVDYLAGADPRDGLLSPVHADLTGLPPMLIQAGSEEYLLDDAVRLAARAAADHVPVTLDVTPRVLHVFQAFAALLEEGEDALTRAAAFLHTHTH